jgi:DNA repair and recombination protein RAD54B
VTAHASAGKLYLLDKMLHEFRYNTEEKVVVVSNWTATLNIIQEICKAKNYSQLRLDGSTATKERQSLVDAFNREDRSRSFVFLLSAKAGGVGLNLVGYVVRGELMILLNQLGLRG